MEGHKNVSAKCPSQQEPPPLTVAALNLKTSLHPQARRTSFLTCLSLHMQALSARDPITTSGQND